jgi:hypothetical protein
MEWKLERSGCVTASRVSDVLARIKSGEAAARRDYKFQLIAERLSGTAQDDGYVSAEMLFGIENEQAAREAYEAAEGVLVEQVGFIKHPRIERSGASPDGCIGDNGLIEIKVPKLATHLNYLLDGVVPTKYQPQILWQLACTGRQYCDFVSFRPDLPPELQLFKVRFIRDDARIREMEAETVVFLAEVDELVAKLKQRMSAQ